MHSTFAKLAFFLLFYYFLRLFLFDAAKIRRVGVRFVRLFVSFAHFFHQGGEIVAEGLRLEDLDATEVD